MNSMFSVDSVSDVTSGFLSVVTANMDIVIGLMAGFWGIYYSLKMLRKAVWIDRGK